jgi:hypothetical protein
MAFMDNRAIVNLGLSTALLLLGVSLRELCAQGISPNDAHCFAIHIRLNGKEVPEPQVIIFRTKENEKAVSLEGGCFKVPAALLDEKTMDVLFTVPGNKIYLSTIAQGFFQGPWDIDLEDKRFGKYVVVPKHVRTTEICAVVFHVGGPEIATTQAPCRSRL